MTTYNTYQEAKIANPKSDIFTKAGKFIGECDLGPSPHTYEYRGIAKCNPADHCMTNNKFLHGGKRIVSGDIVLDGKRVVIINNHDDIETYNSIVKGQDNTYILRAAALGEEKPRIKVEYVKCELSREWEAVKYYNEEGELFVIDCNGNYSNVNDISGAWYEVVCKNYHCIYRRIETPMTEREAFIEAACEITDWNIKKTMGMLFDSGKFKLVN